ncbi:hypothetical protein [Anaerofustis stercorihominis]|nr:hypothetical protein [Anaerofustis stercorihominis]
MSEILKDKETMYDYKHGFSVKEVKFRLINGFEDMEMTGYTQ